MYAEQVGKLDIGGLRHQHTARFDDPLVVDGFKDIVQRALGKVVGINTGKHRFRHIVFHENKGLSADIAHTHKMIAAVPAFELEPCKQFRGIAYPLCTQHLGTVLQVQNPHLGGKAQLLVQEAAAGIGAAHKSTAAPHAFHKAFFDQHIVSLPRNGA